MKHYLLFMVLLFPVFLSNTSGCEDAKRTFKYEGYIIDADGNKQNGYVILKAHLTLDQVKIKFINHKGKKKTYKPKDIKGYGYRDIKDNEYGNRAWIWSHYETRTADVAPVAFGPKTVFMERVTEGEVVLFQYWIQKNTNIEKPYHRIYYLERGNERVKLTEEDFIEKGKLFFSDNETIATNMGKVNHRYRNMNRVVNNYNSWKEKQTAQSF